MAAPVISIFPPAGPPPETPPNPAGIYDPPSHPLPVCRSLLADDRTDPQGRLLVRRWRGDWWVYRGPHWIELDPEALRQWFYERLEHAIYEHPTKNGVETRDWAPDKAKVDRLVDALATPTLIGRDIDAPAWLPTGESAAGYVPCLNGLVNVTTQEITPSTPDYFGQTCIPLEYDPAAGEPAEWLRFLRILWPPIPYNEEAGDEEIAEHTWWEDNHGRWWRDADEIRALRQWYGYILSGRLDLQKALLMIGPPRCGKGTIARTLEALVGATNVIGPTMANLARNFGLEGAVGKTLMVIGDARMPSEGQDVVLQRLLSITGQDTLDVDRKNRQAWTGTLPCRIMISSNDAPRFGDASGAITSRFVILRMTESFLGREDLELGSRILGELPQILKWALQGITDLTKAGRFTEPPSHKETMPELIGLASAVSVFLADVCDTSNPGAAVQFAELYAQYEIWCLENGRGKTNSNRFSADLRSFMPGLKTDYRPRDNLGNKLPRHVKGLQISTEWKTRPKHGKAW